MDIPDCKKKRVGVKNIADLTGVVAYVFVNLHTSSKAVTIIIHQSCC